MSATKINRIHREMAQLRADFQADSLEKITQLMTLCKLTLADLEAYMQKEAHRKTATTGRPVAVKGTRTAIVSKAAAGAKVPKSGNYRRGPQPAKYRNPKTGETWSGLARAPAWIADVKDRSKFLIEQR
ncbi:H-NS histone family protein [Paraburkholderia sp. J8-2]|uniref:H-NS histone family protein n=1 Tax=Paraburkholderia sp. J8-2 TaxID=2805440 RepID=UPI002AB77744|nr:H-NS family nucleoid-associated regulatory protein [Paraburkholderia sp. J8-2]